MSNQSSGTFRLMYRSHSRLPEDSRRAELGDIFSVARSNNKKQDITGALLLTQNWFVQTLEGDETAVRDLFARIEADSRHDQVSVLEARSVDGRVFSRWAMAKVAEDGEPDIPLIAGPRGATVAAGHHTTSEQDEVLETMRAAAQGAPAQ
jgi:hypothetical protein